MSLGGNRRAHTQRLTIFRRIYVITKPAIEWGESERKKKKKRKKMQKKALKDGKNTVNEFHEFLFSLNKYRVFVFGIDSYFIVYLFCRQL